MALRERLICWKRHFPSFPQEQWFGNGYCF
jgi:hypothetical protein